MSTPEALIVELEQHGHDVALGQIGAVMTTEAFKWTFQWEFDRGVTDVDDR